MYIVRKAVDSKVAVEFAAKWRTVEHSARVQYCCKIRSTKFAVQIKGSRSAFICHLDGSVETDNKFFIDYVKA